MKHKDIMKRQISLLIAAVCLIAALCGCESPKTVEHVTAPELPPLVIPDTQAEVPAKDEPQPYRIDEGPDCWFGGRYLGASVCVEDSLCTALSAAAEVLDGTLQETGGSWILEARGHTLRFYPGEAQADFDGETAALPVPVLADGEDWLVPLAPLAQVLGYVSSFREIGEMVYSCMAPTETLIWIDGWKAVAYNQPDGGFYVCLADIAASSGGSFEPDGGDAVLTAFGQEIRLSGGSRFILVNDEPVELSMPVMADGSLWYAPADTLLPLLGLSRLEDPELDQIYYTRIVRNDAIPTGVRVPVLMYHAVSDDIWGITELFVSPSAMEAQLQALAENGYTAVTFEDLDRIDEIEKPIMLTFDDGYDDNYTELFPLLKKYGMKATVFVIADAVGHAHYMTEDQIREMSESGLVSIQSHTMYHGYLNEMDEDALITEHYASMLALARITGKQPFALCYPSGKSSAASRAVTAQYYQYGLNMSGPCYVTGDAPYEINRFYIPRNLDLNSFLSRIAG